PRFDNAVAALAGRWMPWAGKRFDSGAGRGDNLLARSARAPARVLWPLYGMKDADRKLAAFDFNTWIERGAVDPDIDVLVIDYASPATKSRWSRKIERARRLWTAAGSARPPSCTAAGNVRRPASAIGAPASGSDAHATQRGSSPLAICTPIDPRTSIITTTTR